MSYELNLSDFRTVYITYIIIALNLISYLVLNIILGDFYLLFFVQDNLAIANGEKIYSLFSAIFTHANLSHLISNMVAVLIFGAMMEKYYGRFQYLLIYLFAGITGNYFQFLFRAIDYTENLSLGASGAVYGIIAACMLIIDRKNRYLLVLAGIYLIYSFITSFAPGIGTWAHIFGFIAGLILGFLLNFIGYRKSGKNLVPGSLFTGIVDGVAQFRWQIVIFFRNLNNSLKNRKNLHLIPPNGRKADNETASEGEIVSDNQYKETYEKNLLIRFKRLMETELKVRMDRLAAELGTSQTDLLERLIIWREVLPFQLKGEWVEIDNLTNFRDTFDQQMKTWMEDSE